MTKKYQIAVLDDYQDVALQMADWSLLDETAPEDSQETQKLVR